MRKEKNIICYVKRSLIFDFYAQLNMNKIQRFNLWTTNFTNHVRNTYGTCSAHQSYVQHMSSQSWKCGEVRYEPLFHLQDMLSCLEKCMSRDKKRISSPVFNNNNKKNIWHVLTLAQSHRNGQWQEPTDHSEPPSPIFPSLESTFARIFLLLERFSPQVSLNSQKSILYGALYSVVLC